ncbi:hypothetical protein KKH13_04930 [Patescibacteria group bacterium]|nr:hypothetical protein [Patescibacteria group bacterium]
MKSIKCACEEMDCCRRMKIIKKKESVNILIMDSGFMGASFTFNASGAAKFMVELRAFMDCIGEHNKPIELKIQTLTAKHSMK